VTDADAGGGRVLRLLLGLEVAEDVPPWPSQSDVARAAGITRARVGQVVAKGRARWAKLSGLTALRGEIAAILDAEGGLVTAEQLEAAVLAARPFDGSTPEALRQASAATRAAVEVEEALAAPRWALRRSGERRLLAREGSGEAGPPASELVQWALRLGEEADRLALQEPLPAPASVVEALQAVTAPAGAQVLQPARLVRLAAAASVAAAASPRLELYPRDLAADRALRLAAGSFLGLREVEPEELRRRVAGRFPAAEQLPDWPHLTELLASAGIELHWDATAATGRGAYVSPFQLPTLLTSTATSGRITMSQRPSPAPEVSEAGDFHRRLRRTHRDGGFLLVVADPRYLPTAEAALAAHFDLVVVSLERELLRAMRAIAGDKGIDWPVVLAADAQPHESLDWRNLLLLVGYGLEAMRHDLLSRPGTLLVTRVGLLARYGRLDLLEQLRAHVTHPGNDGPHGVWILTGGQPCVLPAVDGVAVPVVTPGEWVSIPATWPRALDPSKPAYRQKSA
jgi:hypothetical protein